MLQACSSDTGLVLCVAMQRHVTTKLRIWKGCNELQDHHTTDHHCNATCVLTFLTPGCICRCIQVHKRMGQLQQFRTYMLDNRRQQLNVDLAAPVNFAEAYQGFIAQVAPATSCRPTALRFL